MRSSKKFKIYFNSLCVLLLSACSSGTYRAPVVDVGQEASTSQRTTVVLGSGPQHRVNEGESLYAIAWVYDLDYNALALANNIQAPYVIFPGQELNLDITNVPLNNTSISSGNQTQAPSVVTRNTSGNAQTRSTGTTNNLLRWVWPAQGNIVATFSISDNENKGIDIAGTNGDPVMAAESGEVVYAGNGLLRYGELIIIKHNDQFLSAYAHNSSINVSEGDHVSRGQQIANLGSTGIDRNMLHFEIRLAGQPVDPENYLPPR
ncbi:peptidoglycan DD-metalloendopeptidase family protein [Haliea sp. AH-315-K21]|uniref:Peptidase M23 n=1 Tax=SAR86 cluster bacterium TaxID=2030880 RepID=A0A2A5CAF1_9GAMM|nr:peptidoglycan DD-metalloendopeptidase family protein [Haliea sp. AH-315-K21]PCJ40468.1 MAG: peptidase M23 [SAR86 cluster bacterium]